MHSSVQYTILHNLQAENQVNPSSYSLLLYSIDDVDSFNLTSPFPTRVVSQTNDQVILNVVLPCRRLWEYQVLPYECHNGLSDFSELSKHSRITKDL